MLNQYLPEESLEFVEKIDNIAEYNQKKVLDAFFENPDETMRNFLIAHPEFLENALASDEKTAARAKLCIDSNLYNL